jgi:hypothetical protein
MATNLSQTTLSTFLANMRSQSGALSVQESQVIDPQLIDIAHNAITFVRNVVGKFVDGFYETTVTLASITVTSNVGTADLTAAATAAIGTISDINGITLFDPTLHEIAILSKARFNGLRSIYTGAQIGTTGAVGMISQVSAKTTLTLYTGATGPLTTIQMTYARNPIKVTATTDTIDIIDSLVPLAQDVGTMYIFRKLAKQPPADFEQRVTGSLNSYLGQLGLKVTPDKTT